MKPKKDKKDIPAPKFDIRINEFGEIEHSFDIDKVNEFLNQTTTDWRINSDENEGRLLEDEEE